MWRPAVLALALSALALWASMATTARCGSPDPREAEKQARFASLEKLIAESDRGDGARIAQQAFRAEAVILASDRDPADVILRRTAALLAHLKAMRDPPDLSAEQLRLERLTKQAAGIDAGNGEARRILFGELLDLRRKIALSNPLLDFDRILFIKRHRLPGEMLLGDHMCDQFFGFHAVAGGGLFVLEDAFGARPTSRDILADSVCENGRFRRKRLVPGAFISSELSYDGKAVLFAYTEGEPTRYEWTQRSTYHIFKVNLDGSELVQLTDGPVNDFDPCWLPDGRILFVSERRAGYGRCHPRPVPLFTLHAMDPDGTGIVRLSHHEANEWQPSIDHHGMIVYTRWDYVDRGNIQAHHPWTTTPDGHDSRAIQGNFGKSKQARPTMEMDLRAIPGSHRYVATAAAHHSQAYGSLVLLNPRLVDDDAMAPLRRLTPEVPFPEAETSAGDAQAYATAWPLDEYFYLCAYDAEGSARRGTENSYGIYLVDALGNKELIYRDVSISCLSPIPLRPRTKPPVLPPRATLDGTAASDPPDTAAVGVINVYNSLKPFPQGTVIKALRIIQILPKTTPLINEPRIGYGNEKGARAVLGTVPVAADGSAYFDLPIGKPVYFQALNRRNLAVQSMRSATYIQRGKRLLCRGCHEPHHSTPPSAMAFPLAFRRPPSTIRPEVDGSRPFSFPRLVQPVLEKHCVACHQKEPQAFDLSSGDWASSRHGRYRSYENLMPFAFFYGTTRGTYDPWTEPRTTPGRFGARASKLLALLDAGHYDVKLSAEDLRRITLWLDCNSDFFGSYENIKAQARGKIVRPTLQ